MAASQCIDEIEFEKVTVKSFTDAFNLAIENGGKPVATLAIVAPSGDEVASLRISPKFFTNNFNEKKVNEKVSLGRFFYQSAETDVRTTLNINRFQMALFEFNQEAVTRDNFLKAEAELEALEHAHEARKRKRLYQGKRTASCY